MHLGMWVAGFGLMSFLLLIHELGHLVAARRLGLAVTQFSIGMGPRLLSRRVGSTEYVWRLLPFGGYVLLPDLAPDEGALVAPVPARLGAVLAGSLANLLLAGILLGPAELLSEMQAWAGALAALFTHAPAEEGAAVMGVVSISAAAGQAATTGWGSLATVAGSLSLQLALANWLPLPGLDGGRALGLLVEWLRGRRTRWEPVLHGVGLMLIAGVGIWLAGRDLFHLAVNSSLGTTWALPRLQG